MTRPCSWIAAPAVVALLVLNRPVMAQPKCPGDLDGDEGVTVNEIIFAINCALNGCPVRFVDNGDGTISDTWTGLMWEKKAADGSVHDKDFWFTWTTDADGDVTNPDGTVFTEFLATLNGTAFAGYADWRLPTIGELQDIVRYDRNPAIDPVFHSEGDCVPGCTVLDCSCTGLMPYHSSTTYVNDPTTAWAVLFDWGGLHNTNKPYGSIQARAVRDER